MRQGEIPNRANMFIETQFIEKYCLPKYCPLRRALIRLKSVESIQQAKDVCSNAGLETDRSIPIDCSNGVALSLPIHIAKCVKRNSLPFCGRVLIADREELGPDFQE